MNDKLRVFIASSQESKNIAEIISENLNKHFDVYPWYHESIFQLSKTPIESLEHLKMKFDAMIVISNYEDKLIKRGIESNLGKEKQIESVSVWYKVPPTFKIVLKCSCISCLA